MRSFFFLKNVRGTRHTKEEMAMVQKYSEKATPTSQEIKKKED